MKKKTIITSLALLAAAAMVGVGTSVGLTAIDTPDQVAAVQQEADGTYLIANKDDFFAIFDKGTTYNNAKIRLTADIDMEGSNVVSLVGQAGMSGDFNGIFDGDGHKVYNIGLVKDASIFPTIGSKGEIKNATFEFRNYTGDGMGAIRPLSYWNNGLIENVTVLIDAASLPIDNVGPLSYASGLGTYRDSNAYYVLGSGNGIAALGKVYHHVAGRTEDETETVENCKYGLTAIDGNVPTNPWVNDPTEGATLLTDDIGYVYVEKSYTIVADEKVTIPAYIVGSADSWDVSWTSSEEGIIDILSYSATEVNIKATAAGDVTLYGIYTKDDKSVETSINIHVDEPTGATGIAIDNKEEIKPTLEVNTSIELSATIEGNSFDEAVWSTSNPDLIEVVQDNEDPLKATLTAKSVAEEAVTITIEIKSAGNTYSDSVEITPVPLQTFDINILVEDTVGGSVVMTGPVIHIMKNDTGSLKAYLTPFIWNQTSSEKASITIDGTRYYIIRQTVGVTEVGLHDANTLYFEYAYAGGTTGKVEITEPVMKADGTWNDVSVLINVEGHIEKPEGKPEKEIVDNKTCTIYAGATQNNEVNEALDFAYNVIAPNWRDTAGSMCHLLNNPEESEALTKITDAYTDDLSSEAKMVLNTISGGDGTSIGQSVQYLINNSKVTNDGSRVGIVNANKSLGTTAIVAIAVTTGAAALGLVYLALRKKSKKAE